MNVQEQVPVIDADEPRAPKVATRPGSKWATGKRTKQKAFEQPKGFARGCRVNQSTKSTNSEKPAK